MRYLRYLALLAVVIVPALYSQAGVSFQVQVGPAYVAPPACPYGYYAYYPYACAPYGYYGPNWFVNGVFIGAGPWYHGYWGHPEYYGRGEYGDHDRGYYGRDRGFRGEGYRGAPRGGESHTYNGG